MIVVTTPTGQIGQQVLEGLLEGTDKPVRVIARDPKRLEPQIRDQVKVIEGSHDDSGVVSDAFTGAESVFWLVPPAPHTENIFDHYRDFTRPACEAIKSQGVERVVAVTSLGRDYPDNAGLLSAAFSMEEMIEGTGVSSRALRMPFFMENLLGQVETIENQGTLFMANRADRALATVATEDIATVATELLLDNSWSGQDSVPVVGPDDLTLDEMAQVMTEVLERPVGFQEVPLSDYKGTLVGFGLNEAWAQGIVDMVAAQNNGIYDSEVRKAKRTPTSFHKWCEDVLKLAVSE